MQYRLEIKGQKRLHILEAAGRQAGGMLALARPGFQNGKKSGRKKVRTWVRLRQKRNGQEEDERGWF